MPNYTPNLPPVNLASLTNVKPDTADNYEVGIKGTIDNRFRYSADIFDIEWHNVQEGLNLTSIVLPGSLNIGNAYSRGVELDLEALVTNHFTTSLSYTYDETKLSSEAALFVVPNVSAPPPAIGSPLPGTPKSSVAVGLEYGHVPLAGGELRYAVDAHYRRAILSALSATAPIVPGYTTADTRLGFVKSHWNGSIYVNNLTNNLGIAAYQDPVLFGNRAMAIVSQPRTFGFTIGYSFKER